MRRLLFVLPFAMAAVSAVAQGLDRDVLVSPGGIVYTVESAAAPEGARFGATYMLSLTARDGKNVSQTVVPASTSFGIHRLPKLAYDTESQTLFVLWLHMPNAMSSELLMSAYRNGSWQPAVSIDDRIYDLRSNLSVGITRRVSQLQDDGTYADVPALLLHAVWWDETGDGEQARYALINLDKGTVGSTDVHNLEEFVDSNTQPVPVDATFNREILKHPAIVDGASSNSVDVVFADARTNLFYHLTMRPVSDARIHIPVGHSGGAPTFAPPEGFTASWSGSVTTLVSPRDRDKVLFCNTTTEGVTYLVHSANGWSDAKTIPTAPTLSAESAIAALVKMISSTE